VHRTRQRLPPFSQSTPPRKGRWHSRSLKSSSGSVTQVHPQTHHTHTRAYRSPAARSSRSGSTIRSLVGQSASQHPRVITEKAIHNASRAARAASRMGLPSSSSPHPALSADNVFGVQCARSGERVGERSQTVTPQALCSIVENVLGCKVMGSMCLEDEIWRVRGGRDSEWAKRP
jgi:hypothetical protein